jgi:hypothetical protein
MGELLILEEEKDDKMGFDNVGDGVVTFNEGEAVI